MTSEVTVNGQFQFQKIARCGFPYRPTCVACDSCEKLLAIGTRFGQIKIYGKEFVQFSLFDVTVNQSNNNLNEASKPTGEAESSSSIWFLSFRSNHGQLISINRQNTICLWDLRTNEENLIRSRTFNKESLTSAHLSPSSKILYIGTQIGNVYILNALTLQLSSYVLHWNKCVGPTVRSRPGSISIISTYPTDHHRLLVGFSKSQPAEPHHGCLCKLNLKTKVTESVTQFNTGLMSLSWNFDGKSFLISHTDGSYSMWSTKDLDRPIKRQRVHAPLSNPDKVNSRPIDKALWINGKEVESKIIFSGGLYLEKELNSSKSTYLTIAKKKSVNLFQMESSIVDMCIFEPHSSKAGMPEPVAIIILLESNLMIVDVKSDDFKYFDCPHNTDFGIKHISYFDYIADPERQLHQNLLILSTTERPRLQASNPNEKSISNAHYPINGGKPGQVVFGYSELIVTGHVDGSVTFWDCSALNLSAICSFNISKFLLRSSNPPASDGSTTVSQSSSSINEPDSPIQGPSTAESSNEGQRDNPRQDTMFAIRLVKFSDDHKELLVAGRSHFIALFTMYKSNEVISEELNDLESLAIHLRPFAEDQSTGNSETAPFEENALKSPLKAKLAYRKQPGWQPKLLCIIKWLPEEPDPIINQISIDSTQKIIVASINNFLIVVDYLLNNVVLNISISDIYSLDENRLNSTKILTPVLADSATNSASHGTFTNNDQDQSSKTCKQFFGANYSVQHYSSTLGDTSPSVSYDHAIELLLTSSSQNSMTSVYEVPSEQEKSYFNDPKLPQSRMSSFSDSQSHYTLLAGCTSGRVIVMNVSITVDQSRFVTIAPTGDKVKLLDKIILMNTINKNDSNNESNRLLLIVSERQVKVLQKHDYSCLAERTLELNVTNAWKYDNAALRCMCLLLKDGTITIFTLPELQLHKVLRNVFQDIPQDMRMFAELSMCLSSHGRGAYLASPTEVEKFTIVEDKSIQINDSTCLLFSTQSPSPSDSSMDQEVPKSGSGESSYSGGSFTQAFFRLIIGEHNIDNDIFEDQLIRSSFTKEPHGIVSPVEVYSGIENTRMVQESSHQSMSDSRKEKGISSTTIARSGAINVADHMSQVIKSGLERGEKLSQLESTAAAMNDRASELKSITKQLAEKEKQRSEKWWQLWRR
ncbi:hypothetical protein ACOME3_009913 [Neoechinorhynchus agilis]